jgi:predicted kinase
VLDPLVSAEVEGLAERYLAGRAPLFDDRISEGRARDGHGDLLAEDIFCLDDGPRVLDCIEFDDRLRWGDVLADVAFLAMDLERLGRPELAARLLALYSDFAADVWPRSLAHHYVAYRAQVRSKVACLRWEQGVEASANVARELLGLAADHLRDGRVRLILIGGLPGTGKSTLADGVAGAIGAVLLRSDEVRKQLAGLDPATPAPAPFLEGLYTPDVTAATYAELLARARVALQHGECVVLDASWTDAAQRDRATEMAAQAVADVDQLHCVAPAEVADARLARRAGRRGEPSDATGPIARALATVEAPWPDSTSIDTTPGVDEVLATALGALEHRPGERLPFTRR